MGNHKEAELFTQKCSSIFNNCLWTFFCVDNNELFTFWKFPLVTITKKKNIINFFSLLIECVSSATNPIIGASIYSITSAALISIQLRRHPRCVDSVFRHFPRKSFTVNEIIFGILSEFQVAVQWTLFLYSAT